MNKLRTIICARLKDYKYLKAYNYRIHSNALQQISQAQLYRTIDENKIKLQLNSINYQHIEYLMELYQCSKSICETYDQTYQLLQSEQSFKEKTVESKLKYLYTIFFRQYGESKQYQIVMKYMNQNNVNLDVGLLLEWFSQWSKTLIDDIISTKQLQLHPKLGKIKQLKVKLKAKNIIKNDSMNSLKITSLKQKIINTNKDNLFSIIQNNSKEILYGFMIDELFNYYVTTSINDLDTTWLKTLKKQDKKTSIFQSNNIQKVVQISIQTKNKSIQSTLRNYYINYYKKYHNALKTVNKFELNLQTSKWSSEQTSINHLGCTMRLNKGTQFRTQTSMMKQTTLSIREKNRWLSRKMMPMSQNYRIILPQNLNCMKINMATTLNKMSQGIAIREGIEGKAQLSKKQQKKNIKFSSSINQNIKNKNNNIKQHQKLQKSVITHKQEKITKIKNKNLFPQSNILNKGKQININNDFHPNYQTIHLSKITRNQSLTHPFQKQPYLSVQKMSSNGDQFSDHAYRTTLPISHTINYK